MDCRNGTARRNSIALLMARSVARQDVGAPVLNPQHRPQTDGSHGAEGEPDDPSENEEIGNAIAGNARNDTKRTSSAAEQVVGQVEPAQYIQRDSAKADRCQKMVISDANGRTNPIRFMTALVIPRW